jgi:hypothetical protein
MLKLNHKSPEDIDSESQLLEEQEIHAYRQIVGSIIYLSNGTRLDLCYAVGQLARHIANSQV